MSRHSPSAVSIERDDQRDVVDLAERADAVRQRLVRSAHASQRTLSAVPEDDVFEPDGTTPVSALAVPFRVPPTLVRVRGVAGTTRRSAVPERT